MMRCPPCENTDGSPLPGSARPRRDATSAANACVSFTVSVSASCSGTGMPQIRYEMASGESTSTLHPRVLRDGGFDRFLNDP